MTRVEFYILPGNDSHSRLLAACRLSAKAWQQQLPVFVRCEDDAQCGSLDELFWSFRPERFIPHERVEQSDQAPILLGLDSAPPPALAQGLLINLVGEISAHVDAFSRVIEIVDQDPARLARSRELFAQYRQRGYAPERIQL